MWRGAWAAGGGVFRLYGSIRCSGCWRVVPRVIRNARKGGQGRVGDVVDDLSGASFRRKLVTAGCPEGAVLAEKTECLRIPGDEAGTMLKTSSQYILSRWYCMSILGEDSSDMFRPLLPY